MAALTPNMITALKSASYSAEQDGIKYSDADAIHTGWSMYRVNANTLRAMVKRGLCMGDGGLTIEAVVVRNELVEPQVPENINGPWIDPECGCERFANPAQIPCPDHAGLTLETGVVTFYCPNCESDILVGFEDSHSASCEVCENDGHSLCQHPYDAKEGRYMEQDMANSFDAAFGNDHTSGNADMTDTMVMADTMNSSYEIWAELEVAVTDGVAVNIGWHRFAIAAGKTEFDIPDMYGSLNGSGNPKDGWASVITVLDSYAA
jgi:hypothetical protein